LYERNWLASSCKFDGAVPVKNNGTRSDMDFHTYNTALEKGRLTLVTWTLANGKLEQFELMPK
jgi:hypothetical protein